MKVFRRAACFCLTVFAVHFAFAHTNSATVTGSVSDSFGCSQGATGASISLSCIYQDDLVYSEARSEGTAGLLSGSIDGNAYDEGDPTVEGVENFYSVGVDVSGTYRLTGGHGMGTVLVSIGHFGVEDFHFCSVQFDGQSFDCLDGAPISLQVRYNQPFQLSLDFLAGGYAGDSNQDEDFPYTDFDYRFSAESEGNLAPVPEPNFVVLLATGFVGVIGASLRRLND